MFQWFADDAAPPPLRTVYSVEPNQTQSLRLRPVIRTPFRPYAHFVPALVVNLIPARRAIISGVELAVIRIFRIRIVGRRSLWLVQRIGSLVLFPHAVHDEHDHEYGAEQANDGTANDSWKRK